MLESVREQCLDFNLSVEVPYHCVPKRTASDVSGQGADALIEVHPDWTRLKARNPSASGMVQRVRAFRPPRESAQRTKTLALLKRYIESLERVLEILEALKRA